MFSMILLAGCAPEPGMWSGPATDLFAQPHGQDVDVLWVVGDPGDPRTVHERLGEAFSAFAHRVDASTAQVRMSVIIARGEVRPTPSHLRRVVVFLDGPVPRELAAQPDLIAVSIDSAVGPRQLAEQLARLGDRATGIHSTFVLSHAAQPATLEVQLDEIPLPHDTAHGWTYDPESWEVSVHGEAVPPPGAVISVTYGVDLAAMR